MRKNIKIQKLRKTCYNINTIYSTDFPEVNIMKKLLAYLITLSLLAGLWAIPSFASDAQSDFDTNYGFVAMNESSRITLQEESVWLTAKEAAKGDIFDYIYKKPVDPNDFELNYTVVNDTTRDNGTHSRFNIYVLPSAGAAPGDGVLIQLIQFALGADNDEIKHKLIVGSGPEGGWDNYASFNEDYSVALKLYSKDGTFHLSVNGSDYRFSGANANLLKSFAANGGAYVRFSARFQEHGEGAYGGDYAVESLKDAEGVVNFGSKYGTQEDRSSDIDVSGPDSFEGVYGDDIKGKLEFTRFDYNSLTPEGTTLNYSVTEEGLSLFGRNDENGFSAGVSYQQPLTLDHDSELSFTLVMPDEVYTYNSNKVAEYSAFVCETPNVNFSGTRSLYLRFSFRADDYKVSSSTPAVLEVIMWDDQDANLVVASNTVTVAPKPDAGNEFTFRIVFDSNANCYKLYVNGQRASTSATELSMTEYFDKIMAAKFLSTTVSLATADRTSGGFAEGDEDMIGFTLRSINGLKLVNESPDAVEAIELYVDDVTDDTVLLSWVEAELPETDFDAPLGPPDGYLVKRSKGVLGDDGIMNTEDDGAFYVEGLGTTSYEDKSVTPDTRYFYTVSAVKNDGGNYLELLSSYSVRAVTSNGEVTDQTEPPAATDAPADATADNSGSGDATPAQATVDNSRSGDSKNNALPVILGVGGAVIVAGVVIALLAVKKKKKG